ncbi:fructokinase [Mucilaginibacter yixingensis]|uniref:Fructokinase n=2 Tax=Mucilaginibacter yixingensis TaxID=1295612 RepID=A0A2T5J7E7_9SPHI|nr:fructokinase [Mucilaginibacter yixingensis]
MQVLKSNKMANKVLCFGEVLWDAFGDEKKPGGAPMNVARHLRQQGIDAQMTSRIGADASGDELVAFLTCTGLHSNLIQRDEELPTCEVTVQLDEQNQAAYIIPQPVSWDNVQADAAMIAAAKQADAIVFGSLACREYNTRAALHTLLDESHNLRVFDVNLRPPHYELTTIEALAARSQVIKMNEEEAVMLIGGSHDDLRGKLIEFQKTYHNQTIIVTRGAEGALVWHDGRFYEHAGQQVQVVDTVGAGDSFLATFVAGLLAGQTDIQKLLNKACAVGAYVTTQRGANPAYPEGLI